MNNDPEYQGVKLLATTAPERLVLNQHGFQPTIQLGILDHFDPEVQAMMLAMYSRNYEPIAGRLPTNAAEEQSLKDRLMKFYVNYGHKSVGQLGTTTVFLEGVSQLAAKAIENHPLFNGQESSTRYIDFATQPMVNFGDQHLIAWQERLRALYVEAVQILTEQLAQEFPAPGDAGQIVSWGWAIKARAFDIAGSLLPSGAVTNVGFTGTFDTLNDHFGEMLYHPSGEMRAIATHVLLSLKEKYRESTPDLAKHFQRNEHVTAEHFYSSDLTESDTDVTPLFEQNQPLQRQHAKLLGELKKYQSLPRSISAQYRFALRGELDFRSFRDLHRHRNGVCIMPRLTPFRGFGQWYQDQLPPHIVVKLNEILQEMAEMAHQFDPVELQYAIPMGVNIPVWYDCDLNQLKYLLELRTGKTVHQTLRFYMHDVWRELTEFDDGNGPVVSGVHPDLDIENFSLKRGTQTFHGTFK